MRSAVDSVLAAMRRPILGPALVAAGLTAAPAGAATVPADVPAAHRAAGIIAYSATPLPGALGDLGRCAAANYPVASARSAMSAQSELVDVAAAGEYLAAMGCLIADPALFTAVQAQLRR